MTAAPARHVLFLVAAAALIAMPLYVSPVANDWILRIGSLMMLAISWNLAANAGLISLGHSAFWGLGSYGALLAANNLGLSFAASLLPATVVGLVVGACLGVITGRLKGFFFAISTLALSEGLRVIAVMTPDFTGGGEGVYITQATRPESHITAVVMVAGALAAFLVAYFISRSRYHFAFRAMRNNEAAAQMFGINPHLYRVVVLSISGAIASLAGGINIWYGGFLDPNIGFDLHITILAQIAPILGGIHTLAGPVIGALVTVGLSEATRIWLAESGFSLLVYGLVLCIFILFLPNGIHGIWTETRTRRKASAARRAGA